MDRSELIAQIPGLRRYARVLTGNAWAADDLVQDTLERACNKWCLWRAGSNLRAWLFTLMHNQFVNHVRRAVRQGTTGRMVDMDDVNDELIAADESVDLTLDLHRCLMRLPEDQRTVLLLVSLEDMSYEDVATITGAPVGTVMSRLSRARTRLRELMDGSPDRAATPRTVGSKPVLHRLK